MSDFKLSLKATLPFIYTPNGKDLACVLHKMLIEANGVYTQNAKAELQRCPTQINWNYTSGGGPPLHISLANEHSDTVLKILEDLKILEAEAKKDILDLSITDTQGKTLLILASKLRNWAVMDELMRFPRVEKILDFQDKDGRTAAHYAAFYGHLGTLTKIKNLGGSLAIQDKFGNTPKGWIYKDGQKKQVMIDLLLSVEVHPLRSRSAPRNRIPALEFSSSLMFAFPSDYQKKLEQQIQAAMTSKKTRSLSFWSHDEKENLTLSEAKKFLDKFRERLDTNGNLLAINDNVLLALTASKFFLESDEKSISFLGTLNYDETSVLDECMQNQKSLLQKWEKMDKEKANKTEKGTK